MMVNQKKTKLVSKWGQENTRVLKLQTSTYIVIKWALNATAARVFNALVQSRRGLRCLLLSISIQKWADQKYQKAEHYMCKKDSRMPRYISTMFNLFETNGIRICQTWKNSVQQLVLSIFCILGRKKYISRNSTSHLVMRGFHLHWSCTSYDTQLLMFSNMFYGFIFAGEFF